MVKIRFTAQGSNAMVGGFSPGDQATIGEALAKHLVEEARVAEYVVAAPAAPAKPPRKPKAAVTPAPTSES